MTNKEALNYLNISRTFSVHPLEREALDIAIKALEFIDENCPKTFIDYLNGEQI